MQRAVCAAPLECSALVAVWRVVRFVRSAVDPEAPTLQSRPVRNARLYVLRFVTCRAECFSNRRALIRIACIASNRGAFIALCPCRRVADYCKKRIPGGSIAAIAAKQEGKAAAQRRLHPWHDTVPTHLSFNQAGMFYACCPRGSRRHNKNPPVGGFLHYWCAVAALVTPMHEGDALPTTHCGRSNTSTSASRASASTISGSPVTCRASPADSTWPLTVRLPRATCT